jgi:FtsP/CotA-like multicopper oxidase with cupredoxin domain
LKSPRTGNTVSYHLEITNGTCNPDGNGDKPCFLINGQYPGPLIEATWGDRLEVTVTNSLLYNGTSLHFHGVRQLGSCGADGVAGITQCPIAPGQSFTYSFLVTQFGSSWYHSHFSNQYGDGVVGPMVFHGPASANYDEDLGTYTLTDWLYTTAAQAGWNSQHSLQTGGGPPVPNNILINGTNKNAAGGGTYNQVVMEKGKKYRLRLINISVDNYFQVSLDGHPLLVMTTDFVPIQPYTTEWLLIGIGQRYDVVIHANQTAGNYWFRANVATECLSSNDHNGRAIWSYDGVPVADPDDNPFPSPTAGCIEPTPSPYWRQSVPSGSFAAMASRVQVNISSAQVVPGGDTVVVWALNDTAISIDWARPTFSYLHDGDSNFTRGMSVVPAVQEGRWNYWLIQQSATAPPIPHPIHLHGHDFHVLGQGHGQYDESQALNWKAPPRRDTATVYAGGWLAMAFPSNNPGKPWSSLSTRVSRLILTVSVQEFG